MGITGRGINAQVLNDVKPLKHQNDVYDDDV